jgi:hypothetical protein
VSYSDKNPTVSAWPRGREILHVFSDAGAVRIVGRPSKGNQRLRSVRAWPKMAIAYWPRQTAVEMNLRAYLIAL